jgi:molybdopterin-containing oxidoreductase family iron-sulfur binding subunit
MGHASVAQEQVYESGKPPLVGDGSAVERRDFMKLLGATFAAASATAACGRLPVHKALPYVDKPEELTVGKASLYATVSPDGGGYSVLVKSRDGRPNKIEGNPEHPLSRGGVSAIGQATILDLYDGDRLKQPKIGGKSADWKAFDAETAKALAAYAADGSKLVVVSKTISGPANAEVLATFLRKFPGARHVAWDGAFGPRAIVAAHSKTHGKAVVPGYDFGKAELILSFGADFLGSWLNYVSYSAQYAPGRKISKDKPRMSKHIQVETRLSLTGSNADDRVRVLPSEVRGAVLALAGKIAAAKSLAVTVPAGETKLAKEVDAWAKLLLDNAGKSLVVSDSDDVAVQAAINVINEALGNYGKTLSLDAHARQWSEQLGDEAALLGQLESGAVTGVILVESNPVYESTQGARWKAALGKAAVSVAVSTRSDETAASCKLVAAANHALESWGDQEPVAGMVNLRQPLINPLFDTRQAEDLLLQWAAVMGVDGKPQTMLGFLQSYWQAAVLPRNTGKDTEFQGFWDKSLREGFAEVRIIGGPVVLGAAPGGPAEEAAPQAAAPAAAAAAPVAAAVAVAAEATAAALPGEASAVGLPADASSTVVLPPPVLSVWNAAGATELLGTAAGKAGTGKFELVLYVKSAIGTGAYSNNPFLQELPDPISKATWGNYICISPKTAQELGGLLSSDVVTVKAGAASVTLPVVLSPGLHDGAIAVAVGYGRSKEFGRVADGIGADAYPLQGEFAIAKADVTPTGAKDPIAFSQTHHSYEHRDSVRETSLTEWQKDPAAGNETLNEMLVDKGQKDKRVTRSIWDRHLYNGYKWGMAIDMNACNGCGACIIACNVENNVPVVGKREVLVRREMHWLRIDRYFSERKSYKPGEYDWDATEDDLLALADNPEVVHMPMLCQHCDNAPCETVCPVLATVHTSEGLNAQAYNRCIGTRYCANNCPYKVRRFNWFNYPTGDMVGKQDVDLIALALNPDITKRSRGVMEKCSFCVQRIMEAKSEALRKTEPDGSPRQPSNLAEVEAAEKEGKQLQAKYIRDGEVRTACQTTCPAEAIEFGDMNDPNSRVRKAYEDPRNYSCLVEVGTQPAVTYQTKVRNAVRAS